MDRVLNSNYVRTRFIQNRTKYFQVYNTQIGLLNRPLFVAVPYEDISYLGEYKAIRASARRRRVAKRGRIHSLNLPHMYPSLGDPTFYSLDVIPDVLDGPVRDGQNHISYWIQVCEKLRGVKDLMDIHRLLRCVRCITDINHYDPHLFKELTREFIDEFHLLSLDEVGTLLRCYVLSNCKPVKLLNKSTEKLSITLFNQLNLDTTHLNATDVINEVEVSDAKNEATNEGKEATNVNATNENAINENAINEEKEGDSRSYAHIALSLSYYGCMTPNVNTLLSLYLIRDWKMIPLSHYAALLRSLIISDDYFHSPAIYEGLLSAIHEYVRTKLPVLYSDDDLIWGLRYDFKRLSSGTSNANGNTYPPDIDIILHLSDLVCVISDLRTLCGYDLFEDAIFSNMRALLDLLNSRYRSTSDVDYIIRSFIRYAFSRAIARCSTAINAYLMSRAGRYRLHDSRTLESYRLEFTSSERVKCQDELWINLDGNDSGNDSVKIIKSIISSCIEYIELADVWTSEELVRMFENCVFINELSVLDSLSIEIIRQFQSLSPRYRARLIAAVNAAGLKVTLTHPESISGFLFG